MLHFWSMTRRHNEHFTVVAIEARKLDRGEDLKTGVPLDEISCASTLTGSHVNDVLVSQLKEERYALYAVLIKEIIYRFLSRQELPVLAALTEKELSWYAIESDFNGANLYFRLSIRLKNALIDDAHSLYDEVKHGSFGEKQDSMKRIVDRLDSIENRVHGESETKILPYMLEEGINNVSEVTTSLLRVIPLVFARENGGPESLQKPGIVQELTCIAHASYPLLAALAAMELAEFSNLRTKLAKIHAFTVTNHFNPDAFIIVGEGNHRRLELKEQLVRSTETISPTIGCPALIAFEQDGARRPNAIKQLWEYVVACGERIYKGKFEEESL